jgi:hypothetical protein
LTSVKVNAHSKLLINLINMFDVKCSSTIPLYLYLCVITDLIETTKLVHYPLQNTMQKRVHSLFCKTQCRNELIMHIKIQSRNITLYCSIEKLFGNVLHTRLIHTYFFFTLAHQKRRIKHVSETNIGI